MKYFLSSSPSLLLLLPLLMLVIICLILLFLNNNLWPLKVKEASSCYALKVSLSQFVCVPEKNNNREWNTFGLLPAAVEQKLFRFESTLSGFLLCAVLYICAIKAFVVTFNRKPFSFIFRLLLPVLCVCVCEYRKSKTVSHITIHPPTHTFDHKTYSARKYCL